MIAESPLALLPLSTDIDMKRDEGEHDDSSLRGGKSQFEPKLEFPPIPPIHPHHTGSVQYSSMMNVDGTVTYRRDINAPCDYGMLVFNVGPSKDDLPYDYDVYGEAYLWSDNGKLCILYPTYTGFQVSTQGPFWTPGFDPTTIRFADLVADVSHMHRISSRMLSPSGATEHAHDINKSRAGDYIIMAHHNFYGINYYKQLKDFVNSWGPDGHPNEYSNDNDNGWVVSDFDATAY